MSTIQHANVVELIQFAFAQHAKHPAYTCLGHTMTYAEISESAERFASFVQNHTDLKPGDRIAVQMPNILQYPIVVYGACLAGLVIVNTNPLYTARELKHQLTDSGARALVVLANVAHTAAAVIADTSVEQVIVTEVGDMLPWPKKTLINFALRYVKKAVPAYEFARATRFSDALALGDKPVEVHQPAADDLFLLQYTGGTTGVAKGAMLTHFNLCSNVRQILGHLKNLFHTPNEVACAALPLYHIYAFNLHALCILVKGGHNILIPNPRDLPALIKAVRPHRISLYIALNTLYNALARNAEFAKLDFSHLKTSAAGGMAITADVARRWHEVTGCEICEGYGLTETSPVIITNPDSAIEAGTIGIPLIDTEIRIVGDQGEVLGDDLPGEIWVKGPQVMLGYWQNDAATLEVMEDGWFKTGDIGVRRADGYYRIVDRKKELIMVSGFKVFPNEVEDVVMLHPGVIEAAVIGVPAETVGEHVKLYAVRTDESVTDTDIIAHCRLHLTPYKVPRMVEFRKELPKSPIGKILRKKLREELVKSVPVS